MAIVWLDLGVDWQPDIKLKKAANSRIVINPLSLCWPE